MNLITNRQLNEWMQEARERVQVRTGWGCRTWGAQLMGPESLTRDPPGEGVAAAPWP